MFVATFYGGHLDGAIYEHDSAARPIADAIVSNAGMMEVYYDICAEDERSWLVPSAERLAAWIKHYGSGYVKIGDPSAADSMLVKVEVR